MWAGHYGRAVTARRQRIAAGVVVGVLLLGACGGDDGASDATDDTETTTSTTADAGGDDGAGGAGAATVGVTTVAEAIPAEVQVYASASEAEPTTTIANPNENGAPLVFLVAQDEGDWLKVHLPVRPNGSTGYIRAADVNLVSNPYSIDIALAEHRLTVRKGDEVIADEAIGVGTQDTPTPGGVYYVKELLQPPDPNGAYGPYAYGLSGFSNELESFAGGDGVIGIHGTNEPDKIGTDVSHGCIRMSNEAITELAGVLPLGTPVHIQA
jgi:lipoprotein-anchoring transpeptidase ErfK/SrfK